MTGLFRLPHNYVAIFVCKDIFFSYVEIEVEYRPTYITNLQIQGYQRIYVSYILF